jgi:hypothetical protein
MTRLLLCAFAVLLSCTGLLHAHHGPPHGEEDEFLEPLKQEAAQGFTGARLLESLALPAAVIVLFTVLSRRENRETPPA